MARRRVYLLILLLLGLVLWATMIAVLGLVWTAVWTAGRELPWWKFAAVGTGFTIAWRLTSDHSRRVRHASARARIWALPVRDQPADPVGGDQERDER